jgi:hypothetical protein
LAPEESARDLDLRDRCANIETHQFCSGWRTSPPRGYLDTADHLDYLGFIR